MSEQQRINPCSRCGEQEVVNPHPNLDLVICEWCAEIVFCDLLADRIRKALDESHRQGEWRTRQAVEAAIEKWGSDRETPPPVHGMTTPQSARTPRPAAQTAEKER